MDKVLRESVTIFERRRCAKEYASIRRLLREAEAAGACGIELAVRRAMLRKRREWAQLKREGYREWLASLQPELPF